MTRVLPTLEFKTKTRCSGHCCQDFQVRGMSRQALLHNALDSIDKGLASAEDDAFIADMLRPVIGPSLRNDRWWTEAHHRFGCRHFDKENKACTVYDQRPAMCRNYPNGEACEFEGCTWDPEEARLVSYVTSKGRIWYEPSAQGLVQIGGSKLERIVKYIQDLDAEVEITEITPIPYREVARQHVHALKSWIPDYLRDQLELTDPEHFSNLIRRIYAGETEYARNLAAFGHAAWLVGCADAMGMSLEELVGDHVAEPTPFAAMVAETWGAKTLENR